jgi:hypothetical protein
MLRLKNKEYQRLLPFIPKSSVTCEDTGITLKIHKISGFHIYSSIFFYLTDHKGNTTEINIYNEDQKTGSAKIDNVLASIRQCYYEVLQ